MRRFLALGLLCARLPAQDSPYKNLDVLRGVPAARIPAIMQAFNGFLGVQCGHCHVEGKWESGEKPAFTRARQMFRARAALNSGPLKDYPGIGCWTCHRGHAQPLPLPSIALENVAWPDSLLLKPEQRTQPAESVFKNIDVFRGLSATAIRGAMSVFSVSLGVSCGHCHAPDDYAADTKPAKAAAHRMMLMVRASSKDFAANALTCFTCHQGAVNPQRNAPGEP